MRRSEPLRLETARLVLRGLRPEDAPAVQQLAGQREIADTMISLPEPCSLAQVQSWLARRSEQLQAGKAALWGTELRSSRELVGAIELRAIDPEHAQAELSFWVGLAFWGRGYAGEAAAAVLAYGFGPLGLNRIYAHHMVRNAASARILEKLGMRQEAYMRQRVRKWGVFEDVRLWAILRGDRPERLSPDTLVSRSP